MLIIINKYILRLDLELQINVSKFKNSKMQKQHIMRIYSMYALHIGCTDITSLLCQLGESKIKSTSTVTSIPNYLNF